jgi:hypothetical protein
MNKSEMLKWAGECRQFAERARDIETMIASISAARIWLELAELADEAEDEPPADGNGKGRQLAS